MEVNYFRIFRNFILFYSFSIVGFSFFITNFPLVLWMVVPLIVARNIGDGNYERSLIFSAKQQSLIIFIVYVYNVLKFIFYFFLQFTGNHLRGSRQESRNVPGVAHARSHVQVKYALLSTLTYDFHRHPAAHRYYRSPPPCLPFHTYILHRYFSFYVFILRPCTSYVWEAVYLGSKSGAAHQATDDESFIGQILWPPRRSSPDPR